MANPGRRRAIKLYNSMKYVEALDLFLKEDVDPAEDTEVAYFLGLTYLKTGNYTEAEHYFKIVIDYSLSLPHLFQSRLLLAYVYNLRTFYDSAEFQLNKLLDEGYSSAQIYALLGYATWKQGLVQEALEHYHKLLELDPGNVNAINSVGFILADSGKDLNEAEKFCRQAVELKPQNGAYLDSLGWTLFKKGEFSQSLNYLKEAARYSNSKSIALHLKKVEENGGA